MTDDVDAPTIIGPPSGPPSDVAALPSGNGTGGSGAAGGDHGPPNRTGKRSTTRVLVEWGILILVAIVIALVIKTFLFQAFYIPSESMVPTLEVGDRVLVNKLSYDLHDLNRGDIVVFAAEPNEEWHRAGIDDLVKRVIALPGETISQCEGDRICIDGRLLEEDYLPKDVPSAAKWTESFPSVGGKLVCDASSAPGTCKVPAGQVFVMGDNRGNSSDSRDHGPIKESSIVGRVFLRIWPLNRLGFL